MPQVLVWVAAAFVVCDGTAITFSQKEANDVGHRLLLTPYIEKGEVQQALRLARVNGAPFDNGVHSYSGFLTVNETFNSNLFFWFFPAERDYESKPLLMWLQGGPGSTSLFGLFKELGPYQMNDSSVVENPYSWHKNHSLLFFDNPVGTGFSFTESDAGYARDQVQVGNDLHSALTQFLTIFQELQAVPLYIAGESFAGKYVPAIAFAIHQRNPAAQLWINLKGIAVGNGFTDPITTLHYSDFVYQLGLVDTRAYEELKVMEANGRAAIQRGDLLQAVKIYQSIQKQIRMTTNYASTFNVLYDTEPDTINDFIPFLQRPEVRKALHVGDTEFKDRANAVVIHMLNDIMNSVRPWLEQLLEHYRVLYYSGQLDAVVPYSVSVRMFNALNFSAAEEYRNATRVPWYVDGELAGYMKSAGKFTEVLVRNAGHMVPADQPKWALDLISRFTQNNLHRY